MKGPLQNVENENQNDGTQFGDLSFALYELHSLISNDLQIDLPAKSCDLK